MKFLLDNWIWILTALTSGGLLLWPTLRGGSASSITAQEAVQLMNREKGIVIDVRSSSDFANGHIIGSRNIALDMLATAKDVPSNKSLPLMLACATGTTATRGVSSLTARGHERVYVLRGGLNAWREANLPIEKSA